MVQSQFTRILLWYLILVGIPYILSKQTEKYFGENASPELNKEFNKNIKELPDINQISRNTQNSLDIRGGRFIVWFTNLVIKATIRGTVWA